jgi:hypothetical protein
MDPESASFLLSVIGKPPLSQKCRPRFFLARKFEFLLNVVVASLHRAAVTCRNRQHDWPAGPGLGKRQELDQQVRIVLHRWKNVNFFNTQYSFAKGSGAVNLKKVFLSTRNAKVLYDRI